MAARFAIAFSALLLLNGAAFAQELDEAPTGFYADPVLSDPAPVPAHAFSPATATTDVAIVAPAAELTPVASRAAAHDTKAPARTACTALNPCAVSAPAARG